MPKVKLLQTNFSSGELSPRAAGRVDIARFQNAAKKLCNVISRTLGGAEKRPGTQYIMPTKNSDKRSRLVPYIVDRDNAFMIEVGDYYMRFFKPDGSVVMNGLVPYEIATNYSESAALELDYTQGEEAMYIFHADVFPGRLRYFSDSYWDCNNAPFTAVPFSENGHQPSASLTLSSNTPGSGRTATASASAFLPTDVDRAIIADAGIAVITGYTSPTVVTVEIKSVFDAATIPAGWIIDASPMATLVPEDLKKDKTPDPVGSQISLTVGAKIVKTTATAKAIEEISHSGYGSTTVTVKVTSHGYSSGNEIEIEGCSPSGYNGYFIVTVIDSDHFTYQSALLETAEALGKSAKVTGSSSASFDTFRPEDVGKYIRMNSGLLKITTFVTAQKVKAEILAEMTAVVSSPPMAWTLESSIWGGEYGYPRTGTLHEQRLIAASTAKNPQTVWGSRTGEPLDFTLGVQDDDAFSFTIGSDESTQISYVSSGRDLTVLAFNGEYSMQGGVEKPITPTNVRIKPQTPHGCGNVRPVQIGKELLLVQRAGRKVRAFGYKYDEDGYNTPDITTLAEHITATGVAEMALQQEPDPVVWVALKNGRLISVTLDRELDVIAWNRHEIDGAVESVATIPAGDSEQVWLIVRRLIDGNVVRYVERLQPDWYPIYGTTMPGANDFPPADEPFNWGFQLDCAVTHDDAAGKATWTGLDHLEGRTVRCLADAIDMGDFVVSSGQITLPRTAKRVLIGLVFVPIIELLTPELQLGEGSSQASAMSVSETGIRMLNTLGATVNGSLVVPGRFIGPDQLDLPPELFTGTVYESGFGWSKGKAETVISQEAPFPFHILSAIRTITINGG